MRKKRHNESSWRITCLVLFFLTPTIIFAQATFTFLPGHPQGSQIVDPGEPFEGFRIFIPKSDSIQLTDAVIITGLIDVTVTDSTNETGEKVLKVTLTFTGPEGEPGSIKNITDQRADATLINFATVRFNDFPGGKGSLSVRFEGTLRNTTGGSISGGEIFQLDFGANNFVPAEGDPTATRFFYASSSDSPGVDPSEPLPSETPMQSKDAFGVTDVSRDNRIEGEFREGAGTFLSSFWVVLGPREEIVAPESVQFTAEVVMVEEPKLTISMLLLFLVLALALLLMLFWFKRKYKGVFKQKT